MSAATMNGGDASRSNANNPASATGSKQQSKSNAHGKALDGTRKQASPVDGQNKKQQPQKAWSGSNPASLRASSHTPNGTEKPLPKLPPQQQKAAELNTEKHMHDRAQFLLAQFVGKDVTITLKSGEQYAGVFSAGSLGQQRRYVIKVARRIRPASDGQINGVAEYEPELAGEGQDHIMSFDIEDTTDLFAEDVTTATATSQQNGSTGGSFMTDTQISARESQMLQQRELQRWDAGQDASIDMSLESTGNAEWDQFAVNESMYGVRSNYDEEIYTTSINRDNPRYRQLQAQAEKIAREIEGSAPATAHVAEERRQNANRDDVEDEEEKYSGVRRDGTQLPKRAAGAYVPPSQRPMTGAPTVPGVPFDPAIVSAQIGKQTSTSPAAPEPIPVPKTDVVNQAAPAPSAETATETTKKGTTEDRVRETADAFKQFANNEKLRARAAQEQKRINQRQEKNVRLNDLKKFAENFKLKSRVPDDLVPILAKDAEKQAEIKLKAEQAAKDEESQKEKKGSDEASTAASPAPSSTVSHAGTAGTVAPPLQAQFNQRTGPRPAGGVANLPPRPVGAAHSPRGPINSRMHQQFMAMPSRPQPLPSDLRIPTGASSPAATNPLSPGTATGLNVNARSFEFRPGASAFTPTGTTPSPQRTASRIVAPAETTVSFFKDKVKGVKDFKSAFDPIQRLYSKEYSEAEKKKYAANDGVPYAYNTQPIWLPAKQNENTTYQSLFPKPPSQSQGPSPMHTPNPNGNVPHQHQLPPHMHHSATSTPYQRPFHPAQHGGAYDPRLQQQFGPNGSVQSSPRVQPPHMASFNGQMPQMGMQLPGQPMPGFGVSPSMQYRQPALQNGPPMIMQQMPGQPIMPMQPGFPPGSQFRGPQMGGHMMVHNPSQGYMNGPVPNPGFSPMPHQAQPHMNQMHQQGPGGYSNSPRPPMMQHGGSHQGFPSGMPMGQPNFAPSPGQAHPMHFQQQQRTMSTGGPGFPHMTPRQAPAMPNHASPGMVGVVPTPGDEGK